jgi:aminomethyltransferase
MVLSFPEEHMDIKTTPLYTDHIKRNALMAPFAGWNMPIHYGSIIEETKHTRTECSVFDICHMGEFIIQENPESSSFDSAITNPATAMIEKRCKYGFLLNDNGTVIDDLIIYRLTADSWMAVVNASNIDRDAKTIQSRLSPGASFQNISDSIVKLDVQGPRSLEVMKTLAGDAIKRLTYFSFDTFTVLGRKCIISRTGYTGELGFEIYIDVDKGVELWHALLDIPFVKPAGLGSRDILRLEAGLPLYGDELTEETTPLEAGMQKYIDFNKKFTGRDALLKQKEAGVTRTLCAIEIDGRRTPRHTNRIIINGSDAGFVTSGVFSPHLGKGIGFAYINCAHAAVGTQLTVSGDKGEMSGIISETPFIKNTSIRYRED